MIRITSAQFISGYSISLHFNDGSEGIVDLGSELYGDIFEPLRNLGVFKNFQLNSELGTIVWASGADFAPEFLRTLLRSAA